MCSYISETMGQDMSQISGFEGVDDCKCSICGISRYEVYRAEAFTRSGANWDIAHTSNPYYAIAWKIVANYSAGKYYNYVHTSASFTDLEIHNPDVCNGYHQRCYDELPVAKRIG